MSAPDTNVEIQRRRHRGPIIGITAGLVFVLLLTLGAFIWPGIPLDQQAATGGVPTEAVEGDAVTGGPSVIVEENQ